MEGILIVTLDALEGRVGLGLALNELFADSRAREVLRAISAWS